MVDRYRLRMFFSLLNSLNKLRFRTGPVGRGRSTGSSAIGDKITRVSRCARAPAGRRSYQEVLALGIEILDHPHVPDRARNREYEPTAVERAPGRGLKGEFCHEHRLTIGNANREQFALLISTRASRLATERLTLADGRASTPRSANALQFDLTRGPMRCSLGFSGGSRNTHGLESAAAPPSKPPTA